MWCTFWRFNSLSNGCPLHQNERDCLFRNLRETHKNIETLLFGNDEININENSIIFNKVRAYIRQNILIYGRSSGLHQYQFISHVSLYCVKYCLGVKPLIHQSELRTYHSNDSNPFQEKSSFHFVVLWKLLNGMD